MGRRGGGGGGGSGGGVGQTATQRLAGGEQLPQDCCSGTAATQEAPPSPLSPTYQRCTTPSLQPCVCRLKQQPLRAARLHRSGWIYACFSVPTALSYTRLPLHPSLDRNLSDVLRHRTFKTNRLFVAPQTTTETLASLQPVNISSECF